MNALPQILRESNPQTLYHRQGLLYSIKLDTASRTLYSTERPISKMRSRLKADRYSMEREGQSNRRRVNYSTISYDHKNDPEFYGTRGKKDQVESYQILVKERQREADIVAIKVSNLRGTKQSYLGQLKRMEGHFSEQLRSFQAYFKGEVESLQRLLSEVRRETHSEIKSFKKELKQQNEYLISYCEELKAFDRKFKRVKEGLEPS